MYQVSRSMGGNVVNQEGGVQTGKLILQISQHSYLATLLSSIRFALLEMYSY
jgi:hypothetical protein